MKTHKQILCALLLACLPAFTPASVADEPTGVVTVTRTRLTGIGQTPGVSRRDPSDLIKVGDLYYVWYSKGPVKTGYNATVWYATSQDGRTWQERGQAIARGAGAAWDAGSVFTPNILVAEGRYWLFYTGTSKPYQPGFNPDSNIGIAVADSPDGPWARLPANPVLKNSANPNDFDSHLVDDSCLMVRDGRYWLYYKGRQLGKSPGETQMGLAIAERPEGPYVKHPANPVIPGNHAVLAWPQGSGVAAMIGTSGPADLINTVQYAADGIRFTKLHDVKDGPRAGGAYRPEAFTSSNQGRPIQWGVEIAHEEHELPYIHRYDIRWPERGLPGPDSKSSAKENLGGAIDRNDEK